ncbi:MAG: MotA/TolQ/ExbB proton channel family protein, partial [Bacteroidota bacterium]
ISLAPMFGFLGTVIGMVEAFDAIEEAGDISPSLVAGGIKVALLTTVFGLITAIILQIFYNYAVSKIDRITADMEEASVELIDSLAMMNMGRSPRLAGRSTATLPSASAELGSGDSDA